MSILMSIFSPMSGKSCPDCGTQMSGGECPECGYGSKEAEDDGEMESEAPIQELMDLKDDLQRIIVKIDRLIVGNSD